MGADSVIYLVQIEGVGLNDNGVARQAFWCYPLVPIGATGAYFPGLAEAPTGVSSRWDVIRQRISIGRFTLKMIPGLDGDPLNYFQLQPDPLGELREPIDHADTAAIKISGRNSDLGLDDFAIVYCDLETIQLGNITASATEWATITRGVCGSTAERHDVETTSPEDAGSSYYAGSDFYDQPPALTGRAVTVYEIDRTRSVLVSPPVDADVILRGFVSGEVAGGIHWPTIEVAERLEGSINDDVEYMRMVAWTGTEGGVPGDARLDPVPEGGGRALKPIGSATGGFWWIPAWGALYKADWVNPGADWSGYSGWRVDLDRLIWSDDDAHPDYYSAVESGDALTPAYLVLYSNADEEDGVNDAFCAFKRWISPSWQADDHPMTPILNMLLSSRDGLNYDAADAVRYDRGAMESQASGALVAGGLFPRFALGVPRAQIALGEFERARAELAGVRAQRLFVGGSQTEELREIFTAAVRPFGYVIGTTRKGVWRPLRLADVYGDADTIALTSADLLRPAEWSHQGLARPLDRVVIEANPGPDGKAGNFTVTVKEVTRRRLYGRHVGDEERIRRAPYSPAVWGPEGFAYNFTAGRIRRMSQRILVLTVYVSSAKFDTIELGDPVSVADNAIRNPKTGARWIAGVGVLGIAVGVDVDWRVRQAKVRIACTATGHVGRHTPALKVTSSSATTNAKVEEHSFTRADEDEDNEHFDAGGEGVGDRVVLLDDHLVLRSSETQHVRITAIDAGADDVDISERFKSPGGATLTINDDDVITFAPYDEVNASQLTNNAYHASGGAPSSGVPALGSGGAAAYEWGD